MIINLTKKYFFGCFLLTILILLYFQLTYWQVTFFGWFLLLAYFWLVGGFAQKMFAKVFGVGKRGLEAKVLSGFFVFLLLSFFNSVLFVWYIMTPFSTWLTYVLVAVFVVFIRWLIDRDKSIVIGNFVVDSNKKLKQAILPKSSILIFLYGTLWWLIFFILVRGKSSEVLFSPWQSISSTILPLFFCLSFLLGLFVFSKHKVKTILFVLLAHSFLLHLYLPVSHVLPWGGDVWRHVAVEEQVMGGEPELPVLFGEKATWRELYGVDVPEALLIPNKYAYGQTRAMTVLLAQTLGVSLLSINKWLLPIVWSLVLPIILFRLGAILFQSWRRGLLFSVLGLLPFSLQVSGSMTLPVSLGHLTFLFVLTLWFLYLRDHRLWQKRLVLILSFLMLFGYTLHFVLIWFVILVSILVEYIGVGRYEKSVQTPLYRKMLFTVLTFASILILPVIELFTKISYAPDSWSFVSQAKQALGQLSGWYFATAIRPHDIISGNIFFNHTPEMAYVAGLFTNFRYHVLLVFLFLAVGLLFGLCYLHKTKPLLPWRVVAFVFSVLVGGYIIGWYVLIGDKLFIRRTDGLVSIFVLFISLLGWIKILNLKIFSSSKNLTKVLLVFFIFLFSWFGTTSYASGPDTRVVSVSEYEAATYIWQNSNKPEQNYCVIGDTWVLLALEAQSGRKIVGGGFPIDYQFAQTERVFFYEALKLELDIEVVKNATKVAGAKKCFVVLSESDVAEKESQIKAFEVTSGEPAKFGNILVWKVDLSQEKIEKE